VTPLLKTGSQTEAQSYRPVALLPSLWSFWETCVKRSRFNGKGPKSSETMWQTAIEITIKPKISGNTPKNFQKTKKYNNLLKTKRTLNTEI